MPIWNWRFDWPAKVAFAIADNAARPCGGSWSTPIVDEFTRRMVELAKTYTSGDPTDEATVVGTVINQQAAGVLEEAVRDAEASAPSCCWGRRQGAYAADGAGRRTRSARLACHECFGPLAPIFPVNGLDDAIEFSNATSYGLSSGIVTSSLESALRAVKEIKAGTVNVNEIPGFRLELSPFGGIKDSGLGIKEGVIDAIKFMTSVKTFSLPW